MTAKRCHQKWKWWPTLAWPLWWGQMCLYDIFFLFLLPCFLKWGKQQKCQISMPWQVETHQPLLALMRHLCSIFLSVELARPQSWRDLAGRTKRVEEGKCNPCKTSARADPEMSTLLGNVSRRLWPIAPGHHSAASSSTDPYDEEEGREALTSVSLEGIQLKGIVQASKHNNGKIRQATQCNGDGCRLCWLPFAITFFACSFSKEAKIGSSSAVQYVPAYSSTIQSWSGH